MSDHKVIKVLKAFLSRWAAGTKIIMTIHSNNSSDLSLKGIGSSKQLPAEGSQQRRGGSVWYGKGWRVRVPHWAAGGIRQENRDLLTKQCKVSCLRVQFIKRIELSHVLSTIQCVCDIRCKFHVWFIEQNVSFSKAYMSLRAGSGQNSAIAGKPTFLSLAFPYPKAEPGDLAQTRVTHLLQSV